MIGAGRGRRHERDISQLSDKFFVSPKRIEHQMPSETHYKIFYRSDKDFEIYSITYCADPFEIDDLRLVFPELFKSNREELEAAALADAREHFQGRPVAGIKVVEVS